MFDFGVVLLGLLGLVFLLGVPYLLISHTMLRTRVRDLEAKVEAMRPGVSSPSQATVASIKSDPVTQSKPALPWGEQKQANSQDDLAETPPIAATSATPAAEADQASEEQPAAHHPSDQDHPSAPPKAFVLRGDLFEVLSFWLRDNWVLVAGSASLALAGVFMVQYGVDNGLLTPFWRVMSALGFGGALVAGGEVVRRRHGDVAEGAAQHLPSALAGAGLITLFAGLLSARVMYGLIDPGTCFAALGLVSVLALVLGWFYGAFLTALGILGACVAPFLVGGQSQDPWMLYYYFALIAVVGLGVDTVKRWAWISVLALVAPLGASLLLYLSGAGEVHFLSALLLMTASGVILPGRSLWPRLSGAAVIDVFARPEGKRRFPEFPTRISAAVTAVSSAAAVMVAIEATQSATVVLALMMLMALLLAALIWMREAPALYDHALAPGLAVLVVVLTEGLNSGPLFQSFMAGLERPPETAPPQVVWMLVALGALGSGLGFLRMRWSLAGIGVAEGGPPRALYWALMAAVFAPALTLLLEFTWAPAVVYGDYPWALVVLGLAAMMTFLAERCARGADREERDLRVALFAIAALTLIAFALFLVLSETALTLALSVLALLVVLIDRKFNLPALVLFIQVAVAVITYRLVLDPGVDWALDRDYLDNDWHYATPLLQIFLAYLGSLALLGAGWLQVRRHREKTALILESAATLIGAVFLSVLILRLLPEEMRYGHAGMGLMATVWAASLVNQLHRLRMSGALTTALRGVLILGYGLAALASLAGLFVFANPLFSYLEMVRGPMILDSLAAAYLPLAGVCAFAVLRLTHLKRWLRVGFAIAGSALGAFYITLEIRRFWRGDDLSLPGVIDAELYSYTVALLLASTGVLMLAFWRRSDLLRKLAMAGVVLTIAKVFLVDMSGLSGLTRVFSFMGLGLALVGLAWLNRVMNAQWEKGQVPPVTEAD
ncbi:DUF2339 domain-containing protein [Pseudophaeobacter sp.]|uniref:DUF2339 domain-containing protein n=1 Tax=Pseudophaeobacter sp. TaxID=1971739 RepID=UPI0032984A13